MKLTNKSILVLVIIVASVLRLYDLFNIPLTHDELSALVRTNYNSFSDLIEFGVKVDGHPAAIQVFLYYWTGLFGDAEWIVKIPFILFGILSVLFIYKIAKLWYNETVGLISAAFLASLQYTIMYSQIARPYISGFLFTLLLVYYWTKLIKSPERRFYLNGALFILSASLCAYNHHFSLLFAAIVGILGLFYIQRKYLLHYIACGIIILLLYIPHLGIFLHQLNYGGVEGWLAKPENDFILTYIHYIFNYSTLTLLVVLGLLTYGFYKFKLREFPLKNFLLFSALFLIPILIGFFYSRYGSAVLQFSVLIFSFPYLLFVLFGHIKSQKPAVNGLIVLLILSVNIYSTVVERQHYNLFYEAPIEQIVVDHQKAQNGNENALSLFDSDRSKTDYYYDKYDVDTNVVWLDSFLTRAALLTFLDVNSQTNDFLYFGCLSGNDPITVSLIMDYFPTIKWQKNYAGGTTYLFSKEKNNSKETFEFLGFESSEINTSWAPFISTNFVDSMLFSGKSSYHVDSATEWSPDYSIPLNKVILNENNFIDISVVVNTKENYEDIVLVAALESGGESIHWQGCGANEFLVDKNTSGEWVKIHQSMKLSDINLKYPDIKLKVYVWNKGKKSLYMDDFELKLRAGNPFIYALIEKI